ncbi:MAG: hypothetical protein GXZ11_04450 [Tissierellia bacterium]|nr:hypothetical protein [Tissierellia bacterium]
MKKRIIALIMVLTLLMAIPVMALEGEERAIPSPQKVKLNGEIVKIYPYNIKDENYFKIRDLAALLKDTSAKFNVFFSEDKGGVVMIPKEQYKVIYDDLKAVGDGPATAIFAKSKVFLGEEELNLTAYLVNDYTYFRLRDLSTLLGFKVEYDAASDTVLITSDASDLIPTVENKGEVTSRTLVAAPVIKTESNLPSKGFNIVETLKDFVVKDEKGVAFKWDYSKESNEFQLNFTSTDLGRYDVSAHVSQDNMRNETVTLTKGEILKESVMATSVDMNRPFTIHVIGIDKLHPDAPILDLIEFQIGK